MIPTKPIDFNKIIITCWDIAIESTLSLTVYNRKQGKEYDSYKELESFLKFFEENVHELIILPEIEKARKEIEATLGEAK